MDNGTCSNISADIIGCMNENYFEFDSNATINNDYYCNNLMNLGCINSTAFNYNSTANFDDGSCVDKSYGYVPNILYLEYDINANTDDGTCETYSIPGCTDPTALNFNEINAEWLSNNPSFTGISVVNYDDGTCIPYIEGCSDSSYLEFNIEVTVDDNSCSTLKILGCTDPLYLEYYVLLKTYLVFMF